MSSSSCGCRKRTTPVVRKISLTYRVIDLVFTEMLQMALYLCRNRDTAPRLYMLGEDNPITRAVSEEELLELWFRANHFWHQGELETFLQPHPLAGELRKIMQGDGHYVSALTWRRKG